MLDAQLIRVERMWEQSFFLITIEQIDDNNYQLKVTGSTGNLYTVDINLNSNNMEELIVCNCPDSYNGAWDERVKCKHCCFVWIKVLKQPTETVALLRLYTRQLNTIKLACNKLISDSISTSRLSNPEYQEKYLELETLATCRAATDKEKFKVTREVTGDCPICFDELRKGVGSQCPTCNNVVHTKCIDRWISTGNSTCVYCRESWKEFTTRSDKSNGLCQPNEYLNLTNFFFPRKS